MFLPRCGICVKIEKRMLTWSWKTISYINEIEHGHNKCIRIVTKIFNFSLSKSYFVEKMWFHFNFPRNYTSNNSKTFIKIIQIYFKVICQLMTSIWQWFKQSRVSVVKNIETRKTDEVNHLNKSTWYLHCTSYYHTTIYWLRVPSQILSRTSE